VFDLQGQPSQAQIREKFKSKIENPTFEGAFSLSPFAGSGWKHIGREKTWVTRPQFLFLEGDNVYYWNSVVTFYRLYERDQAEQFGILFGGERRLAILSVDVHWKATVGSNGRFFDTEVVDFKQSKYSFEQPKEEDVTNSGVLEPAAPTTPRSAGEGDVGSAPPSTGGSNENVITNE